MLRELLGDPVRAGIGLLCVVLVPTLVFFGGTELGISTGLVSILTIFVLMAGLLLWLSFMDRRMRERQHLDMVHQRLEESSGGEGEAGRDRLQLPDSIVRRGGRAVEGSGLENQFRSLRVSHGIPETCLPSCHLGFTHAAVTRFDKGVFIIIGVYQCSFRCQRNVAP